MSSKINFQEDHTSNSHQASTIFNTDYSTENLIERRHLEKPSRFKSFQNWRQNSSFILVGWKYGVKLGVILTSAILILNLGITLGVVLSRGSDKDGKAELMSAECDTIKKYNTGYHLVINTLSTLLLGSSNYIMQILSAPTRQDIDEAHVKGIWLDIGISSLKNLKFISRWKLVLWAFLAASSWPLHLFYNSAVFATLYAHSYDIYTVQGDISSANALNGFDSSRIKDLSGILDLSVIHNKAVHNELIRLNSIDCIEEFSQPFQTRNNLVLLILDNSSGASSSNISIAKKRTGTPPVTNPMMLSCTAYSDNLDWLCQDMNPDSCEIFCKTLVPQLKSNSTWAPFGEKVDHCLVNRAEQQCKLHFSLTIMIIVIVMNAVKMIMICAVAVSVKDRPLLTLGDTIESFLTKPDISDRPSNQRIDTELPRPTIRRHVAISSARWWACMSVCFAATIFVGGWFGYAYDQNVDKKNVWNLGFGAADPRTLILGWSVPNHGVAGVISNALIANLAQPILSMVYFTYNSFMTAMISASEWDNYALFRKGLRVSGRPQGEQRVTHFLQLPYRYSVPLMAFSTLLHWLISQSIFVVSVITDTDKNPSGIVTGRSDWISCGYALTPMAVVFSLGFLLIAYAIIIGRGRLKSNIPISLSNSKLIATECHPEPHREGEAYRRLQWGPRTNEADGSVQYAFSSAPIDRGMESEVSGRESRSFKSRFRLPFKSYDSVKNDEIELQRIER